MYGSAKSNTEARALPSANSALYQTAGDITKSSAPRESGSMAQSKTSGFGHESQRNNPGMLVPLKADS